MHGLINRSKDRRGTSVPQEYCHCSCKLWVRPHSSNFVERPVFVFFFFFIARQVSMTRLLPVRRILYPNRLRSSHCNWLMHARSRESYSQPWWSRSHGGDVQNCSCEVLAGALRNLKNSPRAYIVKSSRDSHCVCPIYRQGPLWRCPGPCDILHTVHHKRELRAQCLLSRKLYLSLYYLLVVAICVSSCPFFL